jgi:uncharacterized RDD family membrane protein YckC
VQPGSSETPETQQLGSEEKTERTKIEETGSRIWDVFLKFWYLGFFVLIYLALAEGGRRIQHRFAYPVILRGIVSSGGRSPIEVKAKHTELQDAVVAHHTTYASTFRRVLGYLIDFLLHIALAFCVFVAVVIYSLIFEADSEGVSDVAVSVSFVLILLSGWLYGTLQVSSKRRATMGMRAVGIFRTDLYGERLSFATASVWYGYRLLSYLGFGLGFVVQPFTKKRQTLHDRMAGTVVLRRPPLEGKPVAPIRLPANA